MSIIDIPVPAPRAGRTSFEATTAILESLRRSGYTIKCDARRWLFLAMKGRVA
ncbi:hypothetical protein LH462_14560 [Laribacter hongkongensis]|uniref:Uncharacterized protein n=1 Tax=Laribacter hongkongensis TaxID=168471 RepID=A0ABD4SUI6_9NEIS|nr:hypothetical protein [Laribacter hongkongensis]MCG9026385.1 hypothetical protein [Laribacter hongkongensis]MCG9101317.1 hypothetical protein [Laribacter hongkongensis]MCG9104929.1 hypothetical protein [Laribacter hongkongensis]MCG9111894.1 hypothetical protein [Laribacter hongkongensis]MCG9118337.1 hypothetical protein [Laribacter hongkongensis]